MCHPDPARSFGDTLPETSASASRLPARRSKNTKNVVKPGVSAWGGIEIDEHGDSLAHVCGHCELVALTPQNFSSYRQHVIPACHTAVSSMSSNGVPLQEISDTVGHRSTHVTETVYRHVIVPAIRGGATVLDTVFGDDP